MTERIYNDDDDDDDNNNNNNNNVVLILINSLKIKVKIKVRRFIIAPHRENLTPEGLRYGSHNFTLQNRVSHKTIYIVVRIKTSRQ